jgi:WbqC-like protein family
VCKALGAKTYLSGPAASGYLDVDRWQSEGITVEFKHYDGYPVYPQLHGSFEHGVTILDVFFNTGGDARTYIRRGSAG